MFSYFRDVLLRCVPIARRNKSQKMEERTDPVLLGVSAHHEVSDDEAAQAPSISSTGSSRSKSEAGESSVVSSNSTPFSTPELSDSEVKAKSIRPPVRSRTVSSAISEPKVGVDTPEDIAGSAALEGRPAKVLPETRPTRWFMNTSLESTKPTGLCKQSAATEPNASEIKKVVASAAPMDPPPDSTSATTMTTTTNDESTWPMKPAPTAARKLEVMQRKRSATGNFLNTQSLEREEPLAKTMAKRQKLEKEKRTPPTTCYSQERAGEMVANPLGFDDLVYDVPRRRPSSGPNEFSMFRRFQGPPPSLEVSGALPAPSLDAISSSNPEIETRRTHENEFRSSPPSSRSLKSAKTKPKGGAPKSEKAAGGFVAVGDEGLVLGWTPGRPRWERRDYYGPGRYNRKNSFSRLRWST